jgi:hypothetical protein
MSYKTFIVTKLPDQEMSIETHTEPNLTLEMVNQAKENSTNPWIGWAFGST